MNTGLNVMTYAIKEWGIGNSAEENILKDWTFIGVPYCNGDFHAGTNTKEYTALDGRTKTIYYEGYNNYRKLVTKIFDYIARTAARYRFERRWFRSGYFGRRCD